MQKGTSHYNISEEQNQKLLIVLWHSLCYSQDLPEFLAVEDFLQYTEVHKQPL